MSTRATLVLALTLAACGGSRWCGSAKEDPTLVAIPAIGQWPAMQLLFELNPRPLEKWDVTPLANAVYLAARSCPEALAAGAATTVRLRVEGGKTVKALAAGRSNACVETAALGKAVPSLSGGPVEVVANLVSLGTPDGGR